MLVYIHVHQQRGLVGVAKDGNLCCAEIEVEGTKIRDFLDFPV